MDLIKQIEHVKLSFNLEKVELEGKLQNILQEDIDMVLKTKKIKKIFGKLVKIENNINRFEHMTSSLNKEKES
jgi:hypothetical protein